MTKLIGHNVGAEQLRSVIERIERLTEEKATIGQDIKEVFTEARGSGLDVKAIRKIIKMRATDAAKLEEEQNVLDVYLSAMGMLPLFDQADQS